MFLDETSESLLRFTVPGPGDDAERLPDNRSFEVFMRPKPNRGMEWGVHNAVAGNTSAPWLLNLRLWAFF